MTIEKRTLKSVRVLPLLKSAEVEWCDEVIREDGSVIASSPFNRAYGEHERARFVADMTNEPAAVIYADLAGLVDPEPVSHAEQVTEPAA